MLDTTRIEQHLKWIGVFVFHMATLLWCTDIHRPMNYAICADEQSQTNKHGSIVTTNHLNILSRLHIRVKQHYCKTDFTSYFSNNKNFQLALLKKYRAPHKDTTWYGLHTLTCISENNLQFYRYYHKYFSRWISPKINITRTWSSWVQNIKAN